MDQDKMFRLRVLIFNIMKSVVTACLEQYSDSGIDLQYIAYETSQIRVRYLLMVQMH